MSSNRPLAYLTEDHLFELFEKATWQVDQAKAKGSPISRSLQERYSAYRDELAHRIGEQILVAKLNPNDRSTP